MRLFVAVWPPPWALDAVAALARPEHPGLRWTTPDQWHVTLRFLGEVAEPGPTLRAVEAGAPALRAVAAATGPGGVRATMGPAVAVLGRHVLVVPVAGLEPLAGAVVAATAGVGEAPPDRPFRGHLTLARARRGAEVGPRALAGAPVQGLWPVTELTVVRSHLSSGGARYEVVHRVALAGDDGGA